MSEEGGFPPDSHPTKTEESATHYHRKKDNENDSNTGGDQKTKRPKQKAKPHITHKSNIFPFTLSPCRSSQAHTHTL